MAFEGSVRLYLAVASADLLCFVVGISSSWTSPILPKLQSDDSPLGRKITQNEYSWIGSLLDMGGIFSPIVFTLFLHRIGRRTNALIAILPFLTAFLTAAFAQNVVLFYFSRVLMGVGTAGMFCSTPIYIVEIAQDNNRGFLSASTGVFLVGGILFSYAVGPFTSIMIFNLILSVICMGYGFAFWFLSPETPYHYLKSDNERNALKALCYLRKNKIEENNEELGQMKEYLASMSEGSFRDLLLTPTNRKALIFSILLTSFQQFSGINVIFTYMQSIFDFTGSSVAPEISSIIVGGVQLLFSFISPLFSDRLGRRKLMLLSISGATVFLTLFGVYFFLKDHNSSTSKLDWLPVFSLVFFMMFYNSGMGSLPWAIISEILPSNVITKGYLIITSIYWIVGWFLNQYFADLVTGIGSAGSFWLFAGLCILHGVFVFFFLIETKGKSFLEIKELLR